MKKKGLTKLACLAMSAVLLLSGNGLLTSASEQAMGTEKSATDTPIAEIPNGTNALTAKTPENPDAPAAEYPENPEAPAADDPENPDASSTDETKGTSESSKEETKGTGESSKEETKATEGSSKEETKATEGSSKEETKATEESSKEETKTTGESSKEETKTTEESSKEETKTTGESSKEETKTTGESSKEGTKTTGESSKEGTKTTGESSKEETKTTEESSKEETKTTEESSKEETKTTEESSKEETKGTEESDAETISVIVIDPLYASELTSEELEELKASLQLSTFAIGRAAAKPCATIDEAAAYMRGQMVDRETSVTIQVPTSLVSSNGGGEKLADDILKKAMEYSDGCTGQEGDALKWGRSGYGARITGLDADNTQISYTFGYHSTADQEQELTAKVRTVLDGLNLNGKSDYEKTRAIHDWICKNVKNETDRGNAARYSAYSAACLGKAVCQGYAVLFYRMCKEAGLSQVRVVGGTMNGGAHGWNLIYLQDGASANSRAAAGGAWYNVDCAWDGQGSEPKYTYFLKADNAFPGHERYAEYNDFPRADNSYFADGGNGWNLTPQYPSGPIMSVGPNGQQQSKPGAASNGGRLYRLDSSEAYYASQDSTQKNKVYVFIQISCPRSPGLANSLNGSIGKFSDTDIYLISTSRDDADIRRFKANMTNPSTSLNFMYLGQDLQDDWLNFTLQPAGKPITGDTPIVVYVDKNNKIQYAAWGASTADAVRQNLNAYCTSSAASESLNNITYHNVGDGINHQDNPPTYQAGVTVMTLCAPMRDGYTFAGWYSDAGYTNKVTQITQSMSGNLNFYAKWEKQPAITYELDGGINASGNPLFFNKGANEISLQPPIKNGYIFAGWYADEAKTKKLADNKLITTAEDGDVTLYAKWTLEQAIQYVLNGGENHSGNRASYKEGEEEFSLYAPTRLDYTFTGWYIDKELTKEIKGITKETAGSLTLYAGWKHNPVDPDNLPKVDMTLTEGNILMGIEGTYITDTAEKILAELNRIRKEACDEGVTDGSGKTLTSADYVPLEWSASLEAIARLRAAEIAVRLDSDHKRPNGKAYNTVSTTANIRSMGENLAANGGSTDIMDAIAGWYREKNGPREEAGHYFNLINPMYKYVAVSAFKLSNAWDNPVATAQEFSVRETMSTAKSEKAGFTLQDVEIAASAVTKLAFKEQSPLGLKIAGTADATVNATVEFKKGVDQILINRSCTGPVRQGIAWKSSDESVAAVDANGKITAKKVGTATITATVGDKSAELKVIVAADTHNTPSTDNSGTGNTSTDNSGTGNSSTDNPGTGNSSTKKPVAVNPPAQQPVTVNPPAEPPVTENPPAQQPGMGNPPAQQPGMVNPPAGQPGMVNPPAQQPVTVNPPAEPPVTNETEKWNNVLAEVDAAKTGDSIRIDMKESSVVPGDVLMKLKGKEVTVILDMGSGITWSIDGKSITADNIGNINFDVKTGTNAIPADVVSGAAGDSDSLQLSLAYDGVFGFTATLSIDLGKERAGFTASLYYYNEKTGQLEPAGDSAIADDGTAQFAFTHASDYLIVMRDSGDNADSRHTGEPWKPWGMLMACSILFMAGIGAFIAIKKRKLGNRSER